TGIYDMSGGAYEYVMGNFNNTIGSSGFTAMPEAKYFNNYPSSIFNGDYNTNTDKCTIETCGGHALLETKAWYGDYSYFTYADDPWFMRGGHYGNSTTAGIFAFWGSGGNGYNDFGFRVCFCG
ncbi:MAG: hypothetical protein RSB71_02315, partial [Bacilli bacterium]